MHGGRSLLRRHHAAELWWLGIRRRRDESGASRDETTFVDIEAWGKQAELVSKYLTKGSPCMIEGRLRLDTWEDKKDGSKRSKLRVTADSLQFTDRKPAGAPPAPTEPPAPPTPPAATRGDEEPPF